ncbi:MAG: prepilin-type N-terminal cleavage/methylation domain-containing protein [Alphaproteobacteria bacterium]|nr:prepilin-type N-terminal cleavage/methylation domain-containing protein [Alphaproteobacteria bacterium]
MRLRPMPRVQGLTLIEVLVALALWALLAALMTQGLDVIVRSQQQQGERDETQARLHNSLSQWQTDLNQIDLSSGLPASLDWNGQVLRLVRHSAFPTPGHRVVVAWGLREGRWVRWQSPPLTQRLALNEAWHNAQVALNADPTPGSPQDWVSVQSWRVFFYRNDSWSNALSSSGNGPATPDAIRLEIDLRSQGAWSGKLQSDWVRPTWSVTRS